MAKYRSLINGALLICLAAVTLGSLGHAHATFSTDLSSLKKLTARWESSLRNPPNSSHGDCQQQVSSFLHSRCATPTRLQARHENGDRDVEHEEAEWLEASAGPPQAEKMRISIEVTRCEIEGAGLKMPAECAHARLEAGGSVQLEDLIKICVE
jgi:hypothetical protein